MKNVNLNIVLLFLTQSILLGQSNFDLKKSTIKYYTTKEGLSQVSVNDICKDRQGFLWLATQNGLNRYDGNEFIVFTNQKGDPGSIPGNYINCVLEDSRGYIWVGTDNNGIGYWNPEKGLFIRPCLAGKERAVSVTSIDEDANGNIWFVLKGKAAGCISFDQKKISNCSFHYFKSYSPTVLHVNSDNTVFIGTKEGSIWTASLTGKQKLNLKKEAYGLTGDITCIKSNSAEKLWVGTRNKLYVVGIKNKLVEDITTNTAVNDNKIENNVIYDVAWDRYQNCWVATGNGLYKIGNKLTGENTEKYHSGKSSPMRLSNNTVYCAEPDSNMVWVGTGKYLNLLVQNPAFSAIDIPSVNEPGTGSNIVFSILETSRGLWVGTSDDGLILFSGNTCYHYSSKDIGLPNAPVFSLQRDSLNNLWIGTKTGLAITNLNKFNIQDPVFKTIRNTPADPTSLSNNFVRQVYCDKKGNIWISTQHGGLNRFTGNLKQGKISFQRVYDKNKTIPEKIYCIIQDKEDNYWLGTSAGPGKLIFTGNGFNQPEFDLFYISKDTLNDNTVYCILEDRAGILWMGTRKGLSYLNTKTKTTNTYNKATGLPDNVIYNIIEDDKANIWVSTNNGLACFDRKNKAFRCYTEHDGLPASEFNLNAGLKDKQNRIYFGSINGIVVFNPSDLLNFDKEAELMFTSLGYNNIDTGNFRLFPKSKSQSIKLDYNNFPLNIGFTNIDIRPFKSVHFAYRILPGNENWNHLENRRNIRIHKLNPGSYTMEIQAISRAKFWSSPPLSLKIHVTPPWWKSKIAFILWVVLLITVIYFIYNWHIQNILTRKEADKLKEIDKIKSIFFANISHEFRTPLTIISGVSREINSRLPDEEKEKFVHDFDIISRNTNNLLMLVNRILGLAKLENNKLNLYPVQSDIISYLKYLSESYVLLASRKKIQLTVYSEPNELIMDFDPDLLAQIISNLLSNAIKFTPENGRILLYVTHNEKDSALIIKVNDTGIGMPDEVQKRIFNRFYQATMSTQQHYGTGIGLFFTKELVMLMKGKIEVKSTVSKGSCFTVQLPVTNKALLKKEVRLSVPVNEQSENSTEHKPEANSLNTKPQLLLIEDNADVSYYIESCLDNQYNVVVAQDGTEGVKQALNLVPDIIITDIMMPQKDGYEVCYELKNNELTNHIPVVMLTAKAGEDNRIAGLGAGVDIYLEKPFNKTELLLHLEQLLKMRKKLQEKYRETAPNVNVVPEQKFLDKAISVIEGKMSDSNFNTSSLAFELQYSESQLYRKVKAISGTSPALLIRSVRLKKAKELLQSTQMNISQIAYETGFKDPSWFSRSFKAEFGYSPKEIRKV